MNATAGVLDPVAREFYRDVMARLEAGGIPFLVGGAYAFERYTGIGRHTKDFDLFIHPRDVQPALDTLRAAGCDTDLSLPALAGQGPLRRGRGGSDLQLRQRRRPGRRPVVPAQRGRARPGRARAPDPGRGDDLVEGVRDGARALRRRRRRPHPARVRRDARLAAPAPALRRLLARAAAASRHVRLRLSLRARAHPRRGAAGADVATGRSS